MRFLIRLIYSIALFLCIGFSGCQKASINGYLDGRWQILEFESGSEIESVKDQQLYYNFYMHVVNLSAYGGDITDGNMLFKDNILWMEFPYINTIDGMEKLGRYGIFSNPVEFEVLTLNKNTLILKEGDLLITLRKF